MIKDDNISKVEESEALQKSKEDDIEEKDKDDIKPQIKQIEEEIKHDGGI
jgi:hypothetical protein